MKSFSMFNINESVAKVEVHHHGKVGFGVTTRDASGKSIETHHFDKHEDALSKAKQYGKDVHDMTEEVELDEAIKLGSKVKMHSPGKDYHDQIGSVGEIRHGLYKGAPKTYTVDYGNGRSVQLDKRSVRLHKEDVEKYGEEGDCPVDGELNESPSGQDIVRAHMNQIAPEKRAAARKAFRQARRAHNMPVAAAAAAMNVHKGLDEDTNNYHKLAIKHLKDSMSKSATPAQKEYARKMNKRALEAAKIEDPEAAHKHYMIGEEQCMVEDLNEGHTYEALTRAGKPSPVTGHQVVGVTRHDNGLKGANILKHRNGGYFASGGSHTSFKKNAKIYDTPEKAAAAYHKELKEENQPTKDTIMTTNMEMYLNAIAGNADFASTLAEKTLTPAEKKKREEIAQAMERENPGMDMGKKMAIATAQAKKVAEEAEQIDELSQDTIKSYVKKVADDAMKHPMNPTKRPAEKASKSVTGFSKALSRIPPEKFFNKEEVELEEGKMDKMSLTQLWHAHAGHDYVADQGYGNGTGSMKHNQRAADAIKSHVAKKYGKDVADDMQSHSDHSTYEAEYAGPKESQQARAAMQKLRAKHNIGSMSEEVEISEEKRSKADQEFVNKASAAIKRNQKANDDLRRAELAKKGLNGSGQKMKEEVELEESTFYRRKGSGDVVEHIPQSDGSHKLVSTQDRHKPMLFSGKDAASDVQKHLNMFYQKIDTQKEEVDLDEEQLDEQGVVEGLPQGMGTALANALSRVEPGSKLGKKMRHHNDMVRRFGPEAGTVTSAPDGYRIDKKGFIRLGQGVAEEVEQLDEEQLDELDQLALRGLHSTDPKKQIGYKTDKGRQASAAKNVGGLKTAIKYSSGRHPKPNLPEEVELEESATPSGLKIYHKEKGTGKEGWTIVFTSKDAARREKELKQAGHTVTGRALMFGKKEGKLRAVTEELDLSSLSEAMISYGDFMDKIAMHRKMGNKVVDDKYTDKHATYTSINPEGEARKVTHTPTGTKHENLGNMKGDDEKAEVKQTEKRGRGRPKGTKSGARH